MQELADTWESIRSVLDGPRGESDFIFVEFSPLTGAGMQLKDVDCDFVVLLDENRTPAFEEKVRRELSDLRLVPISDTVDGHGMLRLVCGIPKLEWKTSGLLLYFIGRCFEPSGTKKVKFYSEKL